MDKPTPPAASGGGSMMTYVVILLLVSLSAMAGGFYYVMEKRKAESATKLKNIQDEAENKMKELRTQTSVQLAAAKSEEEKREIQRKAELSAEKTKMEASYKIKENTLKRAQDRANKEIKNAAMRLREVKELQKKTEAEKRQVEAKMRQAEETIRRAKQQNDSNARRLAEEKRKMAQMAQQRVAKAAADVARARSEAQRAAREAMMLKQRVAQMNQKMNARSRPVMSIRPIRSGRVVKAVKPVRVKKVVKAVKPVRISKKYFKKWVATPWLYNMRIWEQRARHNTRYSKYKNVKDSKNRCKREDTCLGYTCTASGRLCWGTNNLSNRIRRRSGSDFSYIKELSNSPVKMKKF